MQAEAKYYCVDELILGTEQNLGKMGVEVRLQHCLVMVIVCPRVTMWCQFAGSP